MDITKSIFKCAFGRPKVLKQSLIKRPALLQVFCEILGYSATDSGTQSFANESISSK